MKWCEWLEKWNMVSLRMKSPFLEAEWKPEDKDKDAAWELYIELLTRITTQRLPDEYGDERTALESVYRLFDLTREIIKAHGRECIEFTKIAIVILNQKVRPFTAKWHKIMVGDGLNGETIRKEFRCDLEELRSLLKIYSKMLADMAGVEDLTDLDD